MRLLTFFSAGSRVPKCFDAKAGEQPIHMHVHVFAVCEIHWLMKRFTRNNLRPQATPERPRSHQRFSESQEGMSCDFYKPQQSL